MQDNQTRYWHTHDVRSVALQESRQRCTPGLCHCHPSLTTGYGGWESHVVKASTYVVNLVRTARPILVQMQQCVECSLRAESLLVDDKKSYSAGKVVVVGGVCPRRVGGRAGSVRH